MTDFRAESYKKIASDKAKARANETSAGSTFPTSGNKIGYADASVSSIKQGGSIKSGGSAKSSDYIFQQGSSGRAVGSESIKESQNRASDASVSELAQTKFEYQEFKNLQAQGVLSGNARFVSSYDAQRNYIREQMKAGGVPFSSNAYNQFLRETKGIFPVQSQNVGGKTVSSPIPFLNKGEVGFVFSSSQRDKDVYFSPLGRNLGSVMRGEKYQGFNKPILEKQSFFKNYGDYSKGVFDYGKSVVKGAVDTQFNSGAEIIKFASNYKDRSSVSGSAKAYFSGSVVSYGNLYAKNKDVQNFSNLYVSTVAGGVAGRVFGFGRGVVSGLAGRGVISQSAGRYALPSLGLYLTGRYVESEVKSAYNVASTQSPREFGSFVTGEVANFASFTKGFKMGYGSSAFSKRETAINQASAVAQKRVGFYTTKNSKTYLAEGRGDVIFKYFDEGQGRTKSYRLDLRSKNVEYVRYIEEPSATFFFGTKGNPKQSFYSGVLLPSGKQFSSLKVEGGKYLVVDEVVKQGEILPKLTKGFFSRFEPSRRAEPLFSLFGKKFGNYKGDVLARETFEFKNGNYASSGRSRIPISNPVMALNPLTARTTSKREVADLTIQSDISVSKGKFLNANGEFSFTQESYLRASTVKRGVSVETFGSTGVIDVATGKSFPSQVVIKQELPFYRFVDYTPKQKSLIYIEKEGGNIKARLPTESKVLQESSIVAKGFIGESASNSRLNIVRTITLSDFERAKYGDSIQRFSFGKAKFSNVNDVFTPKSSSKGSVLRVEGFVNYGELLGQLRRGGGYLSKTTPERPEALGQFVSLVEGNLKSSGTTKVIIEQVRTEIPVKSQSSSFEMSYSPSPKLQSPKSFSILGLSRSASVSERGSSAVYPSVKLSYSFSSYNLNSVSNVNSLGLSNVSSLANSQVSRVSNNVLTLNKSESRVSQVQENTQITTQKQRQNTQSGFSRINFNYKYKDSTPYVGKMGVFGLIRFPKSSKGVSSSKRRAKKNKSVGVGLRILPDLYSVNVTEGRTSSLFGKSSEAGIPKLTKAVRKSAGLAFGGFGLGLIPTEQIRTKRIKYPKFI